MKGKVEDGQAVGSISINNVEEDCIIDTGAAITVTNINKAEGLRLKDIRVTKIFLTVGGTIEMRYHVAHHVRFGEGALTINKGTTWELTFNPKQP